MDPTEAVEEEADEEGPDATTETEEVAATTEAALTPTNSKEENQHSNATFMTFREPEHPLTPTHEQQKK